MRKRVLAISVLVISIVLAFGIAVAVVVVLPSVVHSTTSVTASSGSGSSQLYKLEFIQQARCPYGGWIYPWAVELNNGQRVVQPSNATLGSFDGIDQNNGNYSQISFIVSNGTYRYTVLPTRYFSQSSNVTIHGNDVVIRVYQTLLAEGCSTTSG